MRPAKDLAAILAEVQRLNSYFKAFRKVQKAFTIRTANEIDGLFAKVDARVQDRPGRKQARFRKGGHFPKW
jgi:hypothetical protein